MCLDSDSSPNDPGSLHGVRVGYSESSVKRPGVSPADDETCEMAPSVDDDWVSLGELERRMFEPPPNSKNLRLIEEWVQSLKAAGGGDW